MSEDRADSPAPATSDFTAMSIFSPITEMCAQLEKVQEADQ